MALMTACPACNKRFKVVPDQLRLHHGLVRCGACDHVFDANHRLEPLPLEDPHSEFTRGFQARIDSAANPNAWLNKPAVQALTQDFDAPTHTLKHGHAAKYEHAGLGIAPWTQVLAHHDAHVLNEIAPETAPSSSTRKTVNNTREHKPSNSSAPSENKENEALSAAATAQRRARRAEKKRLAALANPAPQQSAPRSSTLGDSGDSGGYSASSARVSWAALGALAGAVASGVLLVAVAVQLALAARYPLASAAPYTKPYLSQLCRLTGCQIEPAQWLSPLNLDALSLLSVAKAASPSAAGTHTYRLQATVRNASTLIVKTPAIELSISNAQGQLLARKTLSPQQLGAAPSLAPNSDWLLDSAVLLDALTLGYTARLVY